MARIVDQTGRTIPRADVKSIRYSIYALDTKGSADVRAVGGHDDVALDIEEVLFDSLQLGDSWAVDCFGYNFRHEFDLNPDAGDGERRFQVRYEMTPASGPKSTIVFQLGAI